MNSPSNASPSAALLGANLDVELSGRATPEDCSRLAAALRVMAAAERAQAGRVQGPSFVGSQWGADIIDAHIARADILADAADALVQAAHEQIAAVTFTPSFRGREPW